MSKSSAPLQLKNISKTYGKGAAAVQVLQGANFTLNAGEIVALVGPSGAGKSTLLHIAGLLDQPDTGEVWVNGAKASPRDGARSQLRNSTFGFVYQFHHLLPEFTALENVTMPAKISGKKVDVVRAEALLSKVGLAKRLQHYPNQLSGGEQQRVAVARALMNSPKVLLADEPTGNLDPASAETVQQLFFDLAKAEGLAVLLVTHNADMAKQCDRQVCLEGGKLV